MNLQRVSPAGAARIRVFGNGIAAAPRQTHLLGTGRRSATQKLDLRFEAMPHRCGGPLFAARSRVRPAQVRSAITPPLSPMRSPLRLNRGPNRGWLRLTDVETGLRPLDTTRRIY